MMARHGDVFQCRKFRQQVVKLKHKAQRPIAEGRLLVRAHVGHVRTVKAYRTRRGRIKGPHEVQQGALARTGSPHNGHGGAFFYRQADIFENFQRAAGRGKGFAHV